MKQWLGILFGTNTSNYESKSTVQKAVRMSLGIGLVLGVLAQSNVFRKAVSTRPRYGGPRNFGEKVRSWWGKMLFGADNLIPFEDDYRTNMYDYEVERFS